MPRRNGAACPCWQRRGKEYRRTAAVLYCLRPAVPSLTPAPCPPPPPSPSLPPRPQGDFTELQGYEEACSDSQLGADLPDAPAAATPSPPAVLPPSTSGARRRFSLF